MVDFMQSYVAFFSSNWIGLAILWVLLIILAISGICSLGIILVDCLVWVDVGRFSVRCYEPND